MFFVELPADSEGNTYMRKAVIEAHWGTWDEIPDRSSRPAWIIDGPASHLKHEILILPQGCPVDNRYAETKGPARELTDEEWEQIIRDRAGMTHPYFS